MFNTFKWNFLLVTIVLALGILYFGPAQGVEKLTEQRQQYLRHER